MMWLKRGKREEGFTLIELMVVVAILAILAIIAIPRVMDALERSRNSEAIATATAIRDGMMRFYADFEVYPGDTGADLEVLWTQKNWRPGPVQYVEDGVSNTFETTAQTDWVGTDTYWHNMVDTGLLPWVYFRSAMYEYLDIRNVGVLNFTGDSAGFEYSLGSETDFAYMIKIDFLNATGQYVRARITPEYVVWADAETGDLPGE